MSGERVGRGGVGRGRRVPFLHVVTDDEVLTADRFVTDARAVVEALGPSVALHVRGPGSTGRAVYDAAAAVADACERSGALLVVNDRVDVALALELGAVQLGGGSLPTPAARAVLGPGVLLGRSVHRPDEAAAADADGAAWLLVGTVFATPSHPERAPDGPEHVRRVRARSALPLVAIGGITPARIDDVLAEGADGVAVLRAVWEAPDPVAAALELVGALADEDVGSHARRDARISGSRA